MKYKPPHMAAIFFWPIFTGEGGGHGPLGPPPGSATEVFDTHVADDHATTKLSDSNSNLVN